jgi:hypothetical protein
MIMEPRFLNNAGGEPVLVATGENGAIQMHQPHKVEKTLDDYRICTECRHYFDRNESTLEICPECELERRPQ